VIASSTVQAVTRSVGQGFVRALQLDIHDDALPGTSLSRGGEHAQIADLARMPCP